MEKLFGKLIRKNKCKPLFGIDDIIIKNYKLNPVHDILWAVEFYFDKKELTELEIDFYMDTGKDIYLLRLQDNPQNKIIFTNKCNNRNTLVTYIIVLKKLSKNINKELEIIVKKLKEIRFPKYYEDKMFEIEN
jgi:hypothetical protein